MTLAESIQARMVKAVSRKLGGCAVEYRGQRLPDGSTLDAGMVDTRARSLFAVPVHLVAMAVALGIDAEAL